MRGYFIRSVGSVLLLMLVLVAAMIAGAPYIPGSQVILYTTFEQNFVFHVLDPYRRLSFEVARDLEFNFLYAPAPDGERILVQRWEPQDGIDISVNGVLNLYTDEFTIINNIMPLTYGMWTSDERLVVANNRFIGYLDPATGDYELLHEANFNDAPVAAPNGCCIAYTAFDGVHVYEIATGSVITIDTIHDGNSDFSALRFSPDGTQLAYIAQSAEHSNTDLFTFNFSTGAKRNLTVGIPFNVWSPTWSPDSKKIAFLHGINQGDIFAVDLHNNAIRQVTATTENEQGLMWVK